MAWSHYEISSMTSGPVTTWTPAYTEQALEYIKSFLTPRDRDDDNETTEVLPSIAGLAIELKVNRTKLYSWANDEQTGFADILANTKSLQERFLVNNGLSGDFNPTIAKLVLGKHGYKDETAATGANNQPLFPQETELETVRRAAFAIAKALKDAT